MTRRTNPESKERVPEQYCTSYDNDDPNHLGNTRVGPGQPGNLSSASATEVTGELEKFLEKVRLGYNQPKNQPGSIVISGERKGEVHIDI